MPCIAASRSACSATSRAGISGTSGAAAFSFSFTTAAGTLSHLGLFDAATGRIALLDFGATETVTIERVEQLRRLGRALRDLDAARVTAAAVEAGFVAVEDPPSQTQAVIDMMLTAGEPLAHQGPYDFGASDLFGRVFDLGRAQAMGEGYARTPPADLLFLQRKFVGTFMLCTRLKARVNLAEVFGRHL